MSKPTLEEMLADATSDQRQLLAAIVEEMDGMFRSLESCGEDKAEVFAGLHRFSVKADRLRDRLASASKALEE